MAIKTQLIKEFYGIDQSKDEAWLDLGYAPEARNMDTEDGSLGVAKGYVKHLQAAIPGTGEIKRLYVWRDLVTIRYVVVAGNTVYAYVTTDETPAWRELYTYPDTVNGYQWDFLETKIGNDDHLIIANGEHQLVKWDGETQTAELFGTGETVLETTVSSYTASNLTVVLADDITELAEQWIKQSGIYLGDDHCGVVSVDAANKTLVLEEAPDAAPSSGMAARVPGGVSDIKVNFMTMHYSRMFSAGDYDHPSRLYWSCTPGSDSDASIRTIEDWSRSSVSPDVSGGYVEVGNTGTDPIVGLCSLSNQLVIFKRDSIYRLLGDRPGNYRVYKVDAKVDETINTARVTYGDTPFWMTKTGMYYYDGNTAQRMYNARNIRKLLEHASLTGCKATEHQDKLYFTCKMDGADAVIVYDVQRRAYMLRDGFHVVDLHSKGGVLYLVNDGRYICRFGEGDSYDGEPIEAYWQTPLTDLENKLQIKGLRELMMRTEAGENTDALVITARSGRNETNYRVMLPDNPYDVLEVPLLNEGRTLSFRFENEAGGSWRIRGGVEILFEAHDRTL